LYFTVWRNGNYFKTGTYLPEEFTDWESEEWNRFGYIFIIQLICNIYH